MLLVTLAKRPSGYLAGGAKADPDGDSLSQGVLGNITNNPMLSIPSQNDGASVEIEMSQIFFRAILTKITARKKSQLKLGFFARYHHKMSTKRILRRPL